MLAPNNPELVPLLTRKELAAFLQVGKAAIKNYEAQGLPVIRIGPPGTRQRVRYDREQVLVWLGMLGSDGPKATPTGERAFIALQE